MDAPASWVDVALCYPYGQDDVQALAAESGGCWRSDVIGVSQSGRPLVRLSNSPGEPGGSRPGLFLVARQHSGETPGSWVLDGLLRRLARDRSDALVWAVPLANADGVAQGDYGKDNFPYDLNRAWRPPPMRHETVVYERDIRRWSERCRPCLALDFHAPGACETEGVYAYLPKPEVFLRLHDESARWADALAEALAPRYAASPFRRVARYASRWETPSLCEFVAKVYRIPALALETPYSRCGATVLTREGYREVGASIADAVLRRLGEKP
jgi:murein tripeptide amidase MpaA